MRIPYSRICRILVRLGLLRSVRPTLPGTGAIQKPVKDDTAGTDPVVAVDGADSLARVDDFSEAVRAWWEEEGSVPTDERRLRWEKLLDAYPDLRLEVKQMIAAKVGKSVAHARRRQRTL